MEKKQRPPKRKFKEIYAEQKERIHNKEKLPKEKKKRVACGVFAVLYIIISLFLLLGKCNFVKASSESTQSALGYATVPYNAIIFNTGNDPKYKQYDYPNTNLRNSNTFYSSINEPEATEGYTTYVYQYYFQEYKATSEQISEIIALKDPATTLYYAWIEDGTGAIINGEDVQLSTGFRAYTQFIISVKLDPTPKVSVYVGNYGEQSGVLIWDSNTGWTNNALYRYFFVPEIVEWGQEDKRNGEGWQFMDIIAEATLVVDENTLIEGSKSDIIWKLEEVGTQVTGATSALHEVILSKPSFLMNNNAIRMNIKGNDFVISNSILDKELTPKLWIENSTSENIEISVAVQISYEYVLKTALDNGTTDIQIKQGIFIKTYQYNSTENTAYGKRIEIFPDFRNEIALDPIFNNKPSYYIITDTECDIQITGIDENTLPKISILNWYGWSGGNGTRATMDNFLTHEIGNIRTGEEIPILPEGEFLSWLGNALDGFFNSDIVGVFSLGDVLWIAIGIGSLFAVLKYFAGG